MARKILLIVAAIIVPGGFIALTVASLAKLLQQSERGQKLLTVARRRAPAWATSWNGLGVEPRQAA